ncbi:class I SAM-dependent methyltransferase [Pedobacter sp. ASV12]|uniref:class I SAM-dependent methyltransferase n=1 Tax=Pedobacter sp. ASV12 TaxID=2795120 RepID=UPI0018EE3A37|nr:class I SAM-dependent methyltransferase [Pedobacter sp. ASV12]
MRTSKRWRLAQYFEIRWWKNYLKHKDIDSYLTWKKNYWIDFLAKIDDYAKPVATSKILDAGCGPAGIFIALQNHDVTAIDPLLNRYDKELDHFDQQSYPLTKFHNVSLEDFEQPDSFDLVFCLNAINHVSDLGLAFERLHKSTKKGGILVVSIDAHNHTLLKHLFRLQPADILHPHQYDLKEYEQMLTKLNCTMLKTVLIKREILFNHYVLVARKN